DEAYFEFAEDVDDYPNAVPYKHDNVIVLRTFSKAYGLAGFRVGYAIGHEEIISHMIKTKLTFEPTTLGQAAALAAYQDTVFLARSVHMVKEAKQQLYSFFDEHEVQYVPSISNSVMMLLPTEAEAIAYTQAMLEHGVILRRLPAFGIPNGIRITLGTPEEMEHFEQAFSDVTKSLTTN
ncbi:MAG: aminotransferase class I/II-fold pyridoxal phosphate-dependent enzyme, partial [Bacteroidota bacterium]